jgi:hypothetical protein
MFGWLSNFIRGLGNAVFQGIKWFVNTVIGLGDGVLALVGIMPWKKLKVQAVILVDEHRNALAAREDVQAALDLAADVFAKHAKVRARFQSDIFLLAEIPPGDVLNPACGLGITGAQFASAGSWFRSHQWTSPAGSLLGYGAPVTVFIVNEISSLLDDNKNGCTAPPFLADYSVVEAGAVGSGKPSGSPIPIPPEVDLARRLTLAHEIGHACNLIHAWGDGTIMNAADDAHRKASMSRWQKALFRGSPHVTYL